MIPPVGWSKLLGSLAAIGERLVQVFVKTTPEKKESDEYEAKKKAMDAADKRIRDALRK